jgi:hypothetical protein
LANIAQSESGQIEEHRADSGKRRVVATVKIVRLNVGNEKRSGCTTYAALHMSAPGTKLPIQNVRYSVAIEGKADLHGDARNRRE